MVEDTLICLQDLCRALTTYVETLLDSTSSRDYDRVVTILDNEHT